MDGRVIHEKVLVSHAYLLWERLAGQIVRTIECKFGREGIGGMVEREGKKGNNGDELSER